MSVKKRESRLREKFADLQRKNFLKRDQNESGGKEIREFASLLKTRILSVSLVFTDMVHFHYKTKM